MPTPVTVALAAVGAKVTASMFNALRSNMSTRWFMVTPTVFSSTGTSATVNADGSVSLVGVTAVILSNIFPSASVYGTDENQLRIWGSFGVAGGITAKLCASGVPDSTASSYDLYGVAYSTAGTQAALSSLAASTGWPLGGTGFAGPGTYIDFSLELAHANAVGLTTGKLEGLPSNTGATPGNGMAPVRIQHRVTSTAFDGIQLVFSQAFTGTIKSTTIR